MAQKSETIRVEQIAAENRQLRDSIKQLTVELEQKKRESQIELSLEQVRARTMAMRKSDELLDAALLLFQQVQALGVLPFVCGFNIWDEDKKAATAWMAREDGIEPRFKTSSEEDVYIHIREAAQRGESLFVREQGGDELETHYRYLTSIPEVKVMGEEMTKAGLSWPSFQIMHCAFFSQGYLMFITYEPVPEAYDIFIRFAKVFEQTYTRFLDLQKAEIQAREAKLEVALERVRSRSMAMHKSDELKDVVAVLFQQLEILGVSFDGGAAIHLFNEKSKDAIILVVSPELIAPIQVNLPYDEEAFINNPIILDVWAAKETGNGIFNRLYSFEEKNKYFDYVFKYNNLEVIPQLVRDFILKADSYTASFIAEKNSLLGANSWSRQLFSESDFDVLKRIAKVFEQAYVRFLDLQKAEAQAREAQIEVALERVRTRTMSMHRSDELAEVMSVLCKGILNLGIHPDDMETCYITTFDESKPIGEIYLTYSHGDLLPRSFQIRFDEDSLFKQLFTEWKNGSSFIIGHLEGNNLIQHFDYLFSHIPASIVEMRSSEPTQLPSETFTHALCFSQGYLAIVTRKAVPEYHEVFKRFGSTLQQAYTRFLDLQKAEAQAVQAHLDLIQIQTEKKRAEDALAELRITQNQLIQKEKLASLGELTAGIAHEIQNPLNFINNFSEVSKELLDEMKAELDNGHADDAREIANDVIQNLEKINHHGKRADSIVKGMLLHSQSSSGQNQPTDINALCDEYIRLSYNGLRAKDKSFNTTIKTDFDKTIEKITVTPQDIGRVLVNVLNNAFYAVQQKQKEGSETGYEPTVTVSTKKMSGNVFIRVEDNGNGIPQKIRDKIFQPFFTTKPTGQGTGLGLSLSYDIITKGHGGTLEVESKEADGAVFTITLPG